MRWECDYTFSSDIANIWKFRRNNIKCFWKERWKYKELYGLSTTAFFYHKALGVLLNVVDKQ